MTKREARIQALSIAVQAVRVAKNADWWDAEDENKVIQQVEVVADQLKSQLNKLLHPFNPARYLDSYFDVT